MRVQKAGGRRCDCKAAEEREPGKGSRHVCTGMETEGDAKPTEGSPPKGEEVEVCRGCKAGGAGPAQAPEKALRGAGRADGGCPNYGACGPQKGCFS